jgi:hypothetical protein
MIAYLKFVKAMMLSRFPGYITIQGREIEPDLKIYGLGSSNLRFGSAGRLLRAVSALVALEEKASTMSWCGHPG